MVKVALELIPTPEDLPNSDISQGNTKHPISHFPGKLHSPTRLELTSKISPLTFMP